MGVKMNRKRMLVLAIVALLLSGGVTYLAYKVIKTSLTPVEMTSKVVVAAKKMDLGYRITKDDVKLEPLCAGCGCAQSPSDHF